MNVFKGYFSEKPILIWMSRKRIQTTEIVSSWSGKIVTYKLRVKRLRSCEGL